MRPLIVTLVFLCSLPAAAAAEHDDWTIIAAVIQRHFQHHQPSVTNAVLEDRTVPLPPASERFWNHDERKAYEGRNAEPISLSTLKLLDGFVTADLSDLSSAQAFDWNKFRARYPHSYVVRVSRPGYETNDRAVVRMDVLDERQTITIQYHLAKENGSCKVGDGTLPAVDREKH